MIVYIMNIVKKNEIDLYTFDSDFANLNQKIIKVI